MRPSDIQIPVYYPNDDPRRGGGMDQGDYDNGEIGSDNLRTIAELLGLATFYRLEPQFKRNYIAMCVAARIEAGLLLGVGTGWRDWDQQMANHIANPKQFAHPMYSLHMNRGKYDVAYAIDSVPYDGLDWAHANCARFGINYLDHIPNERHHCQPIELPNGGSKFTDHYADLARTVLDLPYLRTASLADWLEADAEIHVDGKPAPAPDPKPEPTPEPTPEPQRASRMFIVSRERTGQTTTSDTVWFSNDGGLTRQPVASLEHLERLATLGAVDGKDNAKVLKPYGHDSTWKQINALYSADLDRLVGKAG